MEVLRKKAFIAVVVLVCAIGISGCSGRKKRIRIDSSPLPPEATPEATPAESKGFKNLTFGQRSYEKTGELGTIYFDFDKSIIRPEDGQLLEKNAQWIKKTPYAEVLVEGHCDERGTKEYNIALGEKRAESVKKYYTALGIDNAKIEVLSWGEERPQDSGHNETAWAKNRRAETLKRVK